MIRTKCEIYNNLKREVFKMNFIEFLYMLTILDICYYCLFIESLILQLTITVDSNLFFLINISDLYLIYSLNHVESYCLLNLLYICMCVACVACVVVSNVDYFNWLLFHYYFYFYIANSAHDTLILAYLCPFFFIISACFFGSYASCLYDIDHG